MLTQISMETRRGRFAWRDRVEPGTVFYPLESRCWSQVGSSIRLADPFIVESFDALTGEQATIRSLRNGRRTTVSTGFVNRCAEMFGSN